jgi:mRNA interferase MazF
MIATLQWTLFQASLDPVRGSEQSGLRPVLIVSNEEFNQAMPNVTDLPLTSTQGQLFPTEVPLPAGAAGLRLNSIVMAHQVRTISKGCLRREFGVLEEDSLRQAVRVALREHLDLG